VRRGRRPKVIWLCGCLSGVNFRLDPGTTKNGEGRVFPMTTELRQLLKARQGEHDRVKKAGHIVPWVFFREVAKGRGGDKNPQAIVSLNKPWQAGCRLAGCPGRIPHDLRRTAVRNLVRAGISERVAMQMTGHKTRSVFERYTSRPSVICVMPLGCSMHCGLVYPARGGERLARVFG
jgi:integrase